jgi:hypothetical protein
MYGSGATIGKELMAAVVKLILPVPVRVHTESVAVAAGTTVLLAVEWLIAAAVRPTFASAILASVLPSVQNSKKE